MKVNYDPATCIHAGNCVNGLPSVFKVENQQLVIDTSAASEEEIRKTVSNCPSGALTITEVN